MPPPGPGAPGAEGAPAAPTILVVDDERNIRRTLDLVLRGEGYEVLEAATAEEALALLEAGRSPVDLCVLDINLPGMSGLELLEGLRRDDATRELPVIVVSGHATATEAVQTIRLGASDFFEKPLNRERVVVSVRNALHASRLSREVAHLSAQIDARYEMIGQSPPLRRLFHDIEKVAPTKASVLITGESGTGKELVARAIHRLSRRAEGPFVKVNCAAIPRDLVESHLFGHERGAFTGAEARARGFFEQAHGGTLLLDEVGDLDIAAQAKVLRAVQSGEVSRLGSERVLHVDVRVLSATNQDLAKAVTQGRFREDLFFRLAVFPIESPPLRDRMEDLRPLAEAFLAAFCQENGLRPMRLDPAALDALGRRSWPGNVRELRNVIERAAILAVGDVVTIADLPEDPHASPFDEDADGAAPARRGGPVSGRRATLREHRDLHERRYIVQVLESLDWNISRAAVVLGIERTNLHKKIRTFEIKRGEAAE